MSHSNEAYRDAGVDIEEGYKTVRKISEYTKATHTSGVMNAIGSFAGMFELGTYKNPILVSGTDGVGTKLDVAFQLKKYDTVGIDCVAMCVNDILCHGAKALFFLDYMACGKLESSVASEIVKGVADGCLQAGCALIGGETAEMPGFYDPGKYDIAGFSVGVVEKSEIVDGSTIEEGDSLIGIASSGVHSNGFSLIRKLISDFNASFTDKTIGQTLLEPTRIYVKPVLELIRQFKIKGLAHITGGGLFENVPRMHGKHLSPVIQTGTWKRPAIFDHLMSLGVSKDNMYHTFNMGIGFIVCVSKDDTEAVIRQLGKQGLESWNIGHISTGNGELCLE